MVRVKKELRPNYWSVYKAINFRRFTKHREFIDANTGKTLSFSFGKDSEKFDFWLHLCSTILWSSPAFLIIILSTLYSTATIWAFPLGIITVI